MPDFDAPIPEFDRKFGCTHFSVEHEDPLLSVHAKEINADGKNEVFFLRSVCGILRKRPSGFAGVTSAIVFQPHEFVSFSILANPN